MISPTTSRPKKKADTLSFAVRADRELYEKFQRETRAQGMNPSIVIRQFIRSYNDGTISIGLREKGFDSLFEIPQIQSSLTRLSSTLDKALGS